LLSGALQRTLIFLRLLRLLRQLATQRKSRAKGSRAVWNVSVYRDARETFSFFRCRERERPRGPCCLVGSFFPVGNGFLPPSVGLFLFLSCFFFLWIPAGLTLFFPRYFKCDDGLFVLSVRNTAYVGFKRMLDSICYASMPHFDVL
jgi:hypothetical protein